MRKLKIAVIGAGSTYTPELVNGFLTRAGSLDVESFYMMDIDENKNEIVSGLAKRMIDEKNTGARVIVTNDLEEALNGADYVVAQIRVGKLRARILDEKIPLKYDLIGQETTGVGGFFKGLRTIPVIENIANIMERVCRDAWLINFSNPSGMIAQMLSECSKIKFAGLCNGPINMIRHLKEKIGGDFDYDFVGLNHFNWVTRVESGGKNILCDLADDDDGKYGAEMIKTIGGLTGGYLNYYYFRDASLKKLKEQKTTRGEDCVKIEEDLLEMYKDVNLKEKPALLDKRGGALYSEAAVSLIDAIENDLNDTHVVNVKNNGTIPFLEPGDVAEVKCRVGKDGPVPIPLIGDVSEHIKGYVRIIKAYEKLTVKAGLTGDYNAGLAALLMHPLVGDCDRAKAVYDEMLAAHREYLPRFFK